MQAGLQTCASVCTLEAESVDSKNVIWPRLKHVNKIEETFCIISIHNWLTYVTFVELIFSRLDRATSYSDHPRPLLIVYRLIESLQDNMNLVIWYLNCQINYDWSLVTPRHITHGNREIIAPNRSMKTVYSTILKASDQTFVSISYPQNPPQIKMIHTCIYLARTGIERILQARDLPAASALLEVLNVEQSVPTTKPEAIIGTITTEKSSFIVTNLVRKLI